MEVPPEKHLPEIAARIEKEDAQRDASEKVTCCTPPVVFSFGSCAAHCFALGEAMASTFHNAAKQALVAARARISATIRDYMFVPCGLSMSLVQWARVHASAPRRPSNEEAFSRMAECVMFFEYTLRNASPDEWLIPGAAADCSLPKSCARTHPRCWMGRRTAIPGGDHVGRRRRRR